MSNAGNPQYLTLAEATGYARLHYAFPDEDEIIYDFVSDRDWDTVNFKVVSVDPTALYTAIRSDGNTIQHIFEEHATKKQKSYVGKIAKSPSAYLKQYVIVAGSQVIDGFHRIAGFAKAGIQQAQALDLEQEKPEGEGPVATKFTAAHIWSSPPRCCHTWRTIESLKDPQLVPFSDATYEPNEDLWTDPGTQAKLAAYLDKKLGHGAKQAAKSPLRMLRFFHATTPRLAEQIDEKQALVPAADLAVGTAGWNYPEHGFEYGEGVYLATTRELALYYADLRMTREREEALDTSERLGELEEDLGYLALYRVAVSANDPKLRPASGTTREFVYLGAIQLARGARGQPYAIGPTWVDKTADFWAFVNKYDPNAGTERQAIRARLARAVKRLKGARCLS